MAGVDDQIKQAVAALKAGRKAEARSLLEGIVEQDQHHEQAWFYLSAAVDSLEEQEICLENVLAVNPQNVKAQQGLASLRQKKQQPPASPAAGQTSPPGSGEYDPFANTFDSAPSSAPDDRAFDWFSGTSQPASPDETPDTDPYAIPTSVDWGRSDSPAAYGSGQDVEIPSAQEWDAWVQRLNISKDNPDAFAPVEADADQGPFVTGDDEPFGESPYSADDDRLFAEDQSTAETDETYGGPSSWFSAFGEDEPAVEQAGTDEDPFASFNNFDAPVAPRSFATPSPYVEPTEPVQDDFSFNASELAGADEEEDFDFSFDENDDEASADEPAARPVQAAKPSPVPLPGAEFYRLIPGEIEAGAGRVEPRGLIMLGGVVILLVLNVISFAALLL